MNHLLRGCAPISDSGWELLDDEARERLRPSLAARRLVDFSGPHGWEHSATNLGRVETVAAPDGRRRQRARSAGCCRWSSCGRSSRSRGPSCRQRPRRRRRRPRAARRGGAADRASPRTSPSSTAGPRRASPASPTPRPVERSALGESAEDYPRSVARAVEALARGRGRGPLRPRARPRRVHAGDRDRRARRLPAVRPPGEDPRGPDRLGARGQGRGRRSACAAATSSSSRARTWRSATAITTPRRCTSTWRRASPSSSRRRRRRRRSAPERRRWASPLIRRGRSVAPRLLDLCGRGT